MTNLNNVRYELAHNGEVVVGESALADNKEQILVDTFSQYGNHCEVLEQEGPLNTVKLTTVSGVHNTYNIFLGNIRNEKRSPYEKKIQLSGKNPNSYDKRNTLILGIYVYESNDAFKDAIIVSYPIDENIKYETNPSLRGVFTNQILQQAKIKGFVIDKERNLIAFRPEFIFYYLDRFYEIHYENNSETYYEVEEAYSDQQCSLQIPNNLIVFGAPGTGKSHHLEQEKEKILTSESYFERVTFHPDYTYANFVGCYKPVPAIDEDGKDIITYKYVPGPFMRVFTKAMLDKEHNHLLVIEEINRANVAAVFGDVFQLLDRDNSGDSEYEIQTSEDIRKYLKDVYKERANELGIDTVKIPFNMFIWATMNSADQGVYPMDTAFKRRWDFEYISIDEAEDVDVIANCKFTVDGKIIKWNNLRKAINNELIKTGVNEDKLLGPFFIDKNILDAQDNEKFIGAFCNKVIMYLFEDAARTKRTDIFAKGENKLTYSKLCTDFRTKGIDIFVDSIKTKVDFAVVQDENINS